MDSTVQKLQIALIAAAVFLGGYIAHSFVASGGNDAGASPVSELSMDELAKKTLNHISEKYLEPQGIQGSLIGVSKFGEDLYQLNMSFGKGGLTQNATLFVTRDGKLIILGEGGSIDDIVEEDKMGADILPDEKGAGVSSTEVDPYKGRADAPVTIVEYSDYQCPFCQRFWQDTLPLIQSEYIDKGLVKFVFRDFPLSSVHPFAQKAAEAAQCAFEQDKFWEYHDRLFSDFQTWQKAGNDEFKKIAIALGLDAKKFGECIDSGKYAGEVERDLQEGIRAGVKGTPAFFVDGVKIEGAQPFPAFKEVIDAQLSKVSLSGEAPSASATQLIIDTTDAAYILGPANSKVTMIEFNDYQCPFCKRFRDETFDKLLQLFGDNVRYVFMDFPITTIHPQAFITHEAARCAGEQGKYLEYHDKLFANQQVWSRFNPESNEELAELKKYSKELGIDTAVFDECLGSRRFADEVISNLQKGVNAGVTGTPTFFVNGQKVVGAQPLSVFQEVISASLN